jgi:hypothetical protein
VTVIDASAVLGNWHDEQAPGGQLKMSARPTDVTDQLTVTGAFDPEELRDPKTGKWIKDPAGRYLDHALKDVERGKMISHNGHESDRSAKGFNVRFYKREGGRKVKVGEGKTYEHPQDAAEALRRGSHLSDGELKHGQSHIPGGGPKPPEPKPEVHPADLLNRSMRPSEVIKDMSARDLVDADAELTRRAALLGHPGKVSKMHQAVKDEIKRRAEGKPKGEPKLPPGYKIEPVPGSSHSFVVYQGQTIGALYEHGPSGAAYEWYLPGKNGRPTQRGPADSLAEGAAKLAQAHKAAQPKRAKLPSGPDPALHLSAWADGESASPLEQHFVKEYETYSGGKGAFVVKDRGEQNTTRNLAGYAKVPQELRARLAERGAEVHFGTRGITGLDDMADLANEQPSGYTEGRTFAKVAGAVQWRRTSTPGGEDYHAVMAVGGGEKTYGSGSVNVSAHEAAHALDFSSNDLSQMDDFQAIYKQVASKFTITPYYVQKDGPAGQGAREFFAEAFAAWAEYRDTGRPPEEIAQLIIHSVGATPPAHRKYSLGPSGLQSARTDRDRLGLRLLGYFDQTYGRIKRGTK